MRPGAGKGLLDLAYLRPSQPDAAVLHSSCKKALRLGRKNTKKRKNKIDHQEWDHIVMGLRSTGRANGGRRHSDAGSCIVIQSSGTCGRPYTSGWAGQVA